MGEMTVLRLAVDVVPTAEGGRQGPVFDGYRGAIEAVPPGESATVQR